MYDGGKPDMIYRKEPDLHFIQVANSYDCSLRYISVLSQFTNGSLSHESYGQNAQKEEMQWTFHRKYITR
jgi:hypothetical protein